MVSPYIKNEGSVFRPASGHNKHKLYWSLQTNYLKLSTICACNLRQLFVNTLVARIKSLVSDNI